jgi:hypothetical protein
MKGLYGSQNVDLEKEIKDIETDLISRGYIKDGSGREYLNFYKKIADNNDFSYFQNSEQFSNLLKINLIDLYSTDKCLENLQGIDGYDLIHSNQYKLMMAVNEQILLNDYSPSSFLQRMLKILDEKDFEKPFYRMEVLLFLINY